MRRNEPTFKVVLKSAKPTLLLFWWPTRRHHQGEWSNLITFLPGASKTWNSGWKSH